MLSFETVLAIICFVVGAVMWSYMAYDHAKKAKKDEEYKELRIRQRAAARAERKKTLDLWEKELQTRGTRSALVTHLIAEQKERGA